MVWWFAKVQQSFQANFKYYQEVKESKLFQEFHRVYFRMAISWIFTKVAFLVNSLDAAVPRYQERLSWMFFWDSVNFSTEQPFSNHQITIDSEKAWSMKRVFRNIKYFEVIIFRFNIFSLSTIK